MSVARPVPPDFALSYATDMGDIVRVDIDPEWPYRGAWLSFGGHSQMSSFKPTFFDTENISEHAGVNYDQIQPIGRPEGFQVYHSNDNRTISMTFHLRMQGIQPGGSVKLNASVEVYQPAMWLESLKYPWVDAAGISHAPPPVLLQLGNLTMVRAVVSNCEINWLPPYDPETFLPHGADVSMTFTAITPNLGNFSYLAAQNHFEG